MHDDEQKNCQWLDIFAHPMMIYVLKRSPKRSSELVCTVGVGHIAQTHVVSGKQVEIQGSEKEQQPNNRTTHTHKK